MSVPLAPEFRLLCLAARKSIAPGEVSALRDAIRSIADWNAVADGARRHRVAPMVLETLYNHGHGQVPSEIIADLRGTVMREAASCHHQMQEIGRVCGTLEKNGIDCLVLKGVPLSLQLYGDPARRGAGDIDILVDPARLLLADAVLKQAGYVRQGGNVLDRGQMFIQRRIKDVTYWHPVIGTHVELHQRLTENPYLLAWDMPTLWGGRALVTLGSTPVSTLSLDRLMLFLCVHGTLHCWERLRWLVDFADLLRGTGHLDAAMAAADREGFGATMRQAVTLCHDWLGLPAAPRYMCDVDRFVGRFFAGQRWFLRPRPGSLEWLRRYSLWARVETWSLKSDWRFRGHELLSALIWPPDWETIPLPGWLFWLYPFLRPLGWALRRFRRK